MSWTNDNKTSSTYVNDTKTSSSWATGIQYLCDELYQKLTTEDNKKIIIDQSQDSVPTTNWVNEAI